MSHSAFAKLGHISFQGENFLLITLKMIYVHEQLDINILYEIFVCLFVSSLLGGWKSNFDFSSPRVFETLCSSLVFTHFSKYLDADSPRRKWKDVSSLGLVTLFMVFDYLPLIIIFSDIPRFYFDQWHPSIFSHIHSFFLPLGFFFFVSIF